LLGINIQKLLLAARGKRQAVHTYTFERFNGVYPGRNVEGRP
jgi:hypothetical protein